jgi:transcription elongation GreA/GreB family factor
MGSVEFVIGKTIKEWINKKNSQNRTQKEKQEQMNAHVTTQRLKQTEIKKQMKRNIKRREQNKEENYRSKENNKMTKAIYMESRILQATQIIPNTPRPTWKVQD